tara:strand:+ start:133928 stop:134719 length:792 start_codon:yes stop_codon:yes gene_type:complete
MASAAACGSSDDGTGADGGNALPDAAPQNLSDARQQDTNAEVYAHSPTTLYRLDPNTLQVETVANFSGCGEVIDIALDRNSNLYGTSFTGLFSINRTTAVCTQIASGNYPNSLSFVPVGVLDPTTEVLVAYLGSDYVRIDVTTGAITTIGAIGGGLFSSGDIVSVEGGGTYLTVGGPNCGDCLVQVNPADGSLQRNWGELGFSNVWGLAFWGGTAYGFSDSGSAFSIEFEGSTVTTTPIAFPGSPPGLRFWGAGSTTIAPIID